MPGVVEQSSTDRALEPGSRGVGELEGRRADEDRDTHCGHIPFSLSAASGRATTLTFARDVVSRLRMLGAQGRIRRALLPAALSVGLPAAPAPRLPRALARKLLDLRRR
jgi:hypothetical protein